MNLLSHYYKVLQIKQKIKLNKNTGKKSMYACKALKKLLEFRFERLKVKIKQHIQQVFSPNGLEETEDYITKGNSN